MPTAIVALWISRDFLHQSYMLDATENASQSPRLPRRQQTVGNLRREEAVSHQGGTKAGRVEADKAARSAGGSHSVRKKPASSTTGAERRWPQRNTVVHSARVSGSPAPLRVAKSPVTSLVATLRWPPVRCAAGLVFLAERRGSGRPPPAVLMCSFARRHRRGHW